MPAIHDAVTYFRHPRPPHLRPPRQTAGAAAPGQQASGGSFSSPPRSPLRRAGRGRPAVRPAAGARPAAAPPHHGPRAPRRQPGPPGPPPAGPRPCGAGFHSAVPLRLPAVPLPTRFAFRFRSRGELRGTMGGTFVAGLTFRFLLYIYIFFFNTIIYIFIIKIMKVVSKSGCAHASTSPISKYLIRFQDAKKALRSHTPPLFF